MRTNHWWGAALGAGVIAGAVLLAPSAQASPHPASHKTVVKIVVQKKTAANRGRVIVQHHGDAHDHHGDDHHGYGHPTPPPPPPPPVHGGHGGHGDDHHHGYPGGSEPCVTVNVRHDHDGDHVEGKARNGDTGYSNAKAGIYVSSNGKKWDKVAETTTGEDGSFSVKLKGHSGKQVKAVVLDAHGAAGQSGAKYIH